MRRREFITLLGSAAATWPMAARAQQATMPVVGHLHAGGARPIDAYAAGFRRGLNESGFFEGRNIAIDLRGSDQLNLMPVLAAALVNRPVSILVATGSSNSVFAARDATATIPIVFGIGSDPVREGLVASMNRPGGNLTGVSYLSGVLIAKRLELLRQLVPQGSAIALLMNPTNRRSAEDLQEVEAAARGLVQQVLTLRASTPDQITSAMTDARERQVSGVLITSDAFFASRGGQIASLAIRHGIPTTFASREYVVAGGLASYGDSRPEAYREVGRYVARILKGEKPADLPVLQPTKFELVLNLNTARALGLSFPPTLLAIADEVIE